MLVEKERANDAFKNGLYKDAAQMYHKASVLLRERHPDKRVVDHATILRHLVECRLRLSDKYTNGFEESSMHVVCMSCSLLVYLQ